LTAEALADSQKRDKEVQNEHGVTYHRLQLAALQTSLISLSLAEDGESGRPATEDHEQI
jgi:hypothetical protein